MNLLDRLLGHDAWTTDQLLGLAAGLTDEQLDRDWDIGHGTLRATFDHIVSNVEIWGGLMAGRTPEAGTDRTIDRLRSRLERAAAELASTARDVAARGAWDETWLDTLDDPPRRKAFGTAIAHVVTHSMHHRAQVLHMLRRTGVKNLPEGDVFSWETATRAVE